MKTTTYKPVEILPPNGTYVNGALTFGQNTPGAQSVVQEMSQKGHVVGPPLAIGAEGTLGRDVVRINLGNGGTSLAFTPEVSLGFASQSSSVKIGEDMYYSVTLTDRYREPYYDEKAKETRYREPRSDNYYFDSFDEASQFARVHEQQGRQTASYPSEYVRDIRDEAGRIHGTIAPGLAVGLMQDIGGGGYVRLDATLAQNVIGDQETRAGIRLAAGGTVGFFGEVNKRVAGPGAGDVQGKVGLQLRL